MDYVWVTILFLISFEAVAWGWTLNRHGDWIKRHPEMDRRRMVAPSMLKTACAMSSLLSIFVWLWSVHLTINPLGEELHSGTKIASLAVAFFIQLSHVHFCAMTARYSCLPRSMWPLLSNLVSRTLVYTFKIRPPPLNSCDVHRCWNDMVKRRKEGKP